MGIGPPRFYAFDHFRLDPERRLLLRDGERVDLTPKAFEVLLALVRRGGRLATKDELMAEVWPDAFVEENNLTVAVSAVRKALGGRQNGNKYIETISGQGYRFAADVRELEAGRRVLADERRAELRITADEGAERGSSSAAENVTGRDAQAELARAGVPAAAAFPVRAWVRRHAVPAALAGALLLLAVITLTSRQFLGRSRPSVGLVGWWAGKGNANDLAGANHGSLQNGATFAPGRHGPAFRFDGVDDYVSVPDAPALDFRTGDFTVCFWARFDDLENNGNGLVHKDSYADDLAGTYRGWLFNVCDSCAGQGGVGLETRAVVRGRGPATHARYPASNFEPGRWYHLAGVRQSGELRLYVDGSLKTSAREPAPTDVSNDVELNIGSLSAGSRQFFKGLIGDVRVYNRALTADEILFAAGGGIGFWRGDGDALDSVGPNSGTPLNGASFAPGRFGQAFSFDGIDDCVSLGNPEGLKLTLSVTVAAWIRPADFPEGQFATVLAKWSGSADKGSYGLWLVKQGGAVRLLGGVGVARIADGGLSGGSVPLEEWSHVALTYDSAAALRRLYVNGEQVAEQQWPGGILPSNQQVMIGSDGPGFRPFRGLIDEAKIYDRALTAEEIRDVCDAGTPPGRSVAILPFEVFGETPGEEYLGQGLADSLISRLGGIRQLRVRPVSAALKYRQVQDPLAAGRELGVDFVLDGQIRKPGDRLRVTVRLTSVLSGATLWRDTFDEKATDLSDVQHRLTERLTYSLLPELTEDEKSRLRKRGTESAEAYRAYLKGRYHWNRRTVEGFRKAVEEFDRAIGLDPVYAEAYAGLADAYNLLSIFGGMPAAEAFPKAKAAAVKALEIEETNAEAYTSLAAIRDWYELDKEGAEEAYRKAIGLKYNYPTAHHWYALHLMTRRRYEEAVGEALVAHELDPLSSIISTDLGVIYSYAGRHEEAIKQFRKVLETDPNFVDAHVGLGRTYMFTGRYDEAIAEHERALEAGGNVSLLGDLGWLYAASGNRDEARRVLGEMRKAAERRHVPRESFILIYAALGMKDEAFNALEDEFRDGSGYMSNLTSDVRLEGLRSDPRYADLVRRVGLSP